MNKDIDISSQNKQIKTAADIYGIGCRLFRLIQAGWLVPISSPSQDKQPCTCTYTNTRTPITAIL